MSAPAPPPSGIPTVPTGAPAPLLRIASSLAQLGDDLSLPRNVRRGANAARAELDKPKVALDVRIASAVYLLDELASDPNLPTHGRTALWSIMSQLESLK